MEEVPAMVSPQTPGHMVSKVPTGLSARINLHLALSPFIQNYFCKIHIPFF